MGSIYPTSLTSAAPTSARLTAILFSSLALRIRWEPCAGQEDDGCLHRQLRGTYSMGKHRPPPFVYLFMTGIKDSLVK